MTQSKLTVMTFAMVLGTVLALSGCTRDDRRTGEAGNTGQETVAPSDTSRSNDQSGDQSRTETYGQPGEISKGETEKGSTTIETKKRVTRTETESESIPTIEQKSIKADINRLSAEELQKLGLSRQIAGNVVRYRDEHGKFKSIDDLKQVPGMNMSWFNQMRDQLGVG